MGNATLRTWLAAILLAACGCGLSDYEKRMDEQRERLKQIDDEAVLLGDMIDMPSGKDPYGNEIKVPFDIYLRLPKGISGKFPGPEALITHEKSALYRYQGRGEFNVLVAWAKVPDLSAAKEPAKDKPAVDKGQTDPGSSNKSDESEFTEKAFRSNVRGGLVTYIQRTLSLNANPPDFESLEKTSYTTLRAGRTVKLDLRSLSFFDPRPQNASKFLVCFNYFGYRQAAVVYQLPASAATSQDYQRAMEFSLKSLDISTSASSQRYNFKNKK